MGYVGAFAVLLLVQAFLCRRFPSTVQLLVLAQAVFWFIAFVVRPAYLLLALPDSPVTLGDYRLEADSYGASFDRVAAFALLGEAVFVFVLAAASGIFGRHCRRSQPNYQPVLQSPFFGDSTLYFVAFALYALGWVGRIASLGSGGILSSGLGPLADAGAVLLIAFVRARVGPIPLVPVIFGVEFAWSFISHSKEAFVVPILAVLLRFLVSGRGRSLPKLLGVFGPIALVSFFGIQEIRGINTATSVASDVGGIAGAAQGVFVGFIERFDGFSAMTDAVALGPNRWLSPGDAFYRLLEFLLPKGPWFSLDATLGQLWTQEVKSQTFANQYQAVSLAAGPSAEGYALFGWPSLVVENAVLCVATVVLGLLIVSKRLPLIVFAVTAAFQTHLFEQGLFGLAAAVNKGAQAAILAWVLSALYVRWQQRSRSTGFTWRSGI